MEDWKQRLSRPQTLDSLLFVGYTKQKPITRRVLLGLRWKLLSCKTFNSLKCQRQELPNFQDLQIRLRCKRMSLRIHAPRASFEFAIIAVSTRKNAENLTQRRKAAKFHCRVCWHIASFAALRLCVRSFPIL